jgi:hypothetical protein
MQCIANGTPLSVYSEEQLVALATTVWYECIRFIGQKNNIVVDEKDILSLSRMFRSYPRLKDSEVRLACRLYYEKDINICLRGFTLALKEYVATSRQEALHEINKNKPKEQKERPSDKKIFEDAKAIAIEIIQSIIDNKPFTDYGNITYRWLEKQGIIELSNDEKKVIFEQCKQREYENAKAQFNREYARKIESNHPEVIEQIKSLARTEALKICVKHDKHLLDIVKDIEYI